MLYSSYLDGFISFINVFIDFKFNFTFNLHKNYFLTGKMFEFNR